jgi:hypothetical protein
MKIKNDSWATKFINLLGWFVLLLGIYSTIRTTFNTLYYKQYPAHPVIGFGSYPQFDEECYEQNVYPLYDPAGQVRKPTAEEERIRSENINNCLKKLERVREQTKTNDRWTSFMLVFLGGGILYTKRFYIKES